MPFLPRRLVSLSPFLVPVLFVLISPRPGFSQTATAAPPPAKSGFESARIVERKVLEAFLRTHKGATDARSLKIIPITWTDGSLGCPKPGEAATKELISGFRATVVWKGTQYIYNTDHDGGRIVHCPSATPPPKSRPARIR